MNPVGTDTAGEFIELWNHGLTPVPLTGWTLVDGKGKTYAFVDTTVPAGGYASLPYSQTHLTLTNSGGTIMLNDPAGATQSTVTYDGEGAEGQSYSRTTSGAFSWSETPTPNAENRFPIATTPPPVITTTTSEPTPAPADTSTPSSVVTDASVPTPVCNCSATTSGTDATPAATDVSRMSGLGDLPDGTAVTLHGVVSLAPGRVGTTIFAAQEADGSAGTYIREYATIRPDLHVGDAITITGKVARAGTSMRVSTSTGGVVLAGTSPGAHAVTTAFADLTDRLDGVTIVAEGTLVESGKGWMLLADASGKNELHITFVGTQAFTSIPAQSSITVIGVLHYVDGKPELLADDATMRSTPPTPVATTQGSTPNASVSTTVASAAASPVVGGTLALCPVVASLGVLGWKKWRGIPLGLS